MATKGVLDSKLPDEHIYVTADFTALFATGVTIGSAVTTCTRYGGAADASPSAMISGTSAISGHIVSQLVIAGNVGTTYLLKFSATGSDASVIDIQLLLPVVAVRLG